MPARRLGATGYNGKPMVTGLNHVTLAVSDLPASIRFYRDVLGCELISRQASGAYFSVGGTWLCLSRDPAAALQVRSDYTHLAFSVADEDFDGLVKKLHDQRAAIWQQNRSEGRSVYFLDPDGHKLELHVGTLETRLAAMRGAAVRQVDGSGCTV